jgi:para-nitrobenzyl esterase
MPLCSTPRLNIGTRRLLCAAMALPLLLTSAAKPQSETPAGPLVHLSDGIVKGKMAGQTAIFQGIPFAAPPIGQLRWREPQPVVAWTAIKDATKPSRPCMQSLAGVDGFIRPLAAAYGVDYPLQQLDPSEDCLYLNVWTPDLHPGAKLPVMVWLHGGSNRAGSGVESAYDGTSLTSHGVIVVTINYRLGVIGFFAHPELTAESPHHSSGNYGLLDQLAALQWVKRNIAQFGGDPNNVTLFGESAGSVDSTTLMTSPLSTNLFRRVIAESGPAFGGGAAQDLSKMHMLGVAVGKAAGVQSGPQIETLRTLPAAEVAKLESTLIASQFEGYDPNAAIVDGWVLPQAPARAFASGAIQRVDLLTGVNAREFSAFRLSAAAAAKAAPQPPKKPGMSDQIATFANTARPLYGHWTNLAVATYMGKMLVGGAAAVDQATNDIIGACPTGAEAALTAITGRHAFVYRFDRSVPGKGEADLGAFHSLEIPYVFGTFQSHTFNWLPFNATDYKLSQTIQIYWTNFAKTGDPNGARLPQWAPWTPDSEPFLSFGENGEAIPQQNFSPIYCHLSPERLKAQLQ